MSLPTPYSPSYSFSDFAISNPQSPLPGDQLAIQLQALAAFTADLNGFLANVFQANGDLKTAIIESKHLAPELEFEIDAPTQAYLDAIVPQVQALKDAIDLVATEVENDRSGAASSAATAAAMAAQTTADLATTTLRAQEAADAASSAELNATESENWAKWSEYWANWSKLHEEQSYKWAEYLAGPVEIPDPSDPQYHEAVDNGYWSAKWWAQRAQAYATGWGVFLNGTKVGTDQQIINFTGSGVSVVVDPDDSKRIKVDIPYIEGKALGGKADVFVKRAGGELEFRTLESKDGTVTVTETTGTIDFSFPGATGEANTGANVGGKAGVFRDKTALALNFKSLESSDATISFTENADTIDLKITSALSGPGSSVDDNLVVWDGTEGTKVKDGAVALGDVARRSQGNTFTATQSIQGPLPRLSLEATGANPGEKLVSVDYNGANKTIEIHGLSDDGNSVLTTPLTIDRDGKAIFAGEVQSPKITQAGNAVLDVSTGVVKAPTAAQTITSQNAAVRPLELVSAASPTADLLYARIPDSSSYFRVHSQPGVVTLARGTEGPPRLNLENLTGPTDQKIFGLQATGGRLEIITNLDNGAFKDTELKVYSTGGLVLGDLTSPKGTGTLHAKSMQIHDRFVPVSTSDTNPPSNYNDANQNFREGDLWICTGDAAGFFRCLDPTPNAAVWIQDMLPATDTGKIPPYQISRIIQCGLHAGGYGFSATDSAVFWVPSGAAENPYVQQARRVDAPRGGPARRMLNVGALDGLQLKLSNPVGAGGLDMGVAAVQTWYRVFLVSGSSGHALVASTDSGAPTWTNLSGYSDWFAAIGWVRSGTTVATNMQVMGQYETVVTKVDETFVSGGTPGRATYPLALYVPACRAVRLRGYPRSQSAGSTARYYVYPGVLTLPANVWYAELSHYRNSGSTDWAYSETLLLELESPETPQVSVESSGVSSEARISVIGWEYRMEAAR